MKKHVLLAVAAAVGATAFVAPATAAPPAGSDCVAQFVSAFMQDFPGFTIGDVQGHDGLPIPGYPFGTGGQAHYLQPFG
jgi:hypothetical protein